MNTIEIIIKLQIISRKFSMSLLAAFTTILACPLLYFLLMYIYHNYLFSILTFVLRIRRIIMNRTNGSNNLSHAEKVKNSIKINYIFENKTYTVHLPYSRSLKSAMSECYVMARDNRDNLYELPQQPGIPYFITPNDIGLKNIIMTRYSKKLTLTNDEMFTEKDIRDLQYIPSIEVETKLDEKKDESSDEGEIAFDNGVLIDDEIETDCEDKPIES